MGHRPPPPRPIRPGPDPRLWPDLYVADLRVTMRRGRYSLFPSRRRRAYEAVLQMIRWREADLWPEPAAPGTLYVSPPKTLPCGHPSHRRYSGGCTECDSHPGDFYELVDGSGQLYARIPRTPPVG